MTALVAVLAASCGVAAAQAVSVTVAGRPAACDPPPRELDGHLLLPAAFLTDRLGMRVEAAPEPGAWRISSYGRQLKVSKDSPRCTIGMTASQAAHPARILDERLYVPAEMITRAFGIMWGKTADGRFELRPPGATIQEVREGRHDERLRLVLDLTAPAPFWSGVAPGELTIELPPPEPRPADWGSLRLFTFADPMRPRVAARVGEAGWLRLSISYQGGRTPSVLTLGEPPRLVVDIPRAVPLPPAPAPAAAPPAPAPAPAPTRPPPVPEVAPVAARGAGWEVRNFSTERGPVRVFALRAAPTSVRPALAGATIRGRAPVSVIAARAGAPVAVNGGYFDHTGPPLGLLVIDGEWIKHPIRNRAALGITEDGKALMGRVRFEGAVRVNGLDKIDLDGLNTGHWQEQSVILYTRRWGEALTGSPTKLRVIVGGDARIARIVRDASPVPIPPDGYVLSAGGPAAGLLARAQPGASVAVTLATVPAWPKLRHAIGAGPQLVAGGARNVTAQEELFRSDVMRICSRTAVGIGADGDVIIAAAEATLARGLSLSELASVMWKLGCREAMALDGGGSTTVVAHGRVINQPSGGGERPVSNALLVFGP